MNDKKVKKLLLSVKINKLDLSLHFSVIVMYEVV